ncbi:MAG TPA: sigma 54-interacting transcriptional regulator [Candidatus Nitrosotalea sp.]|nr:sigma 54-interacting transcriptional regulator [Candidatus Nitrosotalea sp.]
MLTQDFENIVNQSYSSAPKYTEIMAGVPEDYKAIRTLGALLEINYKIVGAKEQLRRNLISKIRSNSAKYPGIIGFEDDVVPALDRAILSGHDVMLVGQIGQAKTKIAQSVAENLLSPMPVVRGSITHDCPMDLPAPELVSLLNGTEEMSSPRFYVDSDTKEKIRDHKLDTPIEWVHGKDRFKYVLATPDISVKDLVGQIDAIKVTRKGTEMYEIESYSPGQLMQAKHGLFCIDELPVLDTRKQVALLSVLQEGRFTTGAYPVIFEPRTAFFATANPIDYTHAGKIIEPLYDRLKSHIHTHYPRTVESEMLIVAQESRIPKSFVPVFMLKLLVRVAQNARKSQEINQDKGVSVRMSVHGLELLVGEAERTRALSHDIIPVPRPSDIFCIGQSAKFELAELDDTLENRQKTLRGLIDLAVKETALEYLGGLGQESLENIKKEFAGKNFVVSQSILGANSMANSYENQMKNFAALAALVDKVYQQALSDQGQFAGRAKAHGIAQGSLEFSEPAARELRAAALELTLDGLCLVEPKILDRKEGAYVAA